MKRVLWISTLILLGILVYPFSKSALPDTEDSSDISVSQNNTTTTEYDFDKATVRYTVEIPDTDLVIRIVDEGTDWPFGAGHVSIYRNSEKFCSTKVYNDGKPIHESDFSAEWDDTNVYITIYGEEQDSKIIKIPINDEVQQSYENAAVCGFWCDGFGYNFENTSAVISRESFIDTYNNTIGAPQASDFNPELCYLQCGSGIPYCHFKIEGDFVLTFQFQMFYSLSYMDGNEVIKFDPEQETIEEFFEKN